MKARFTMDAVINVVQVSCLMSVWEAQQSIAQHSSSFILSVRIGGQLASASVLKVDQSILVDRSGSEDQIKQTGDRRPPGDKAEKVKML